MLNNQKVPRTCIMGIGISGNFLKTADGVQYKLLFRPNCEWIRAESRCKGPNGADEKGALEPFFFQTRCTNSNCSNNAMREDRHHIPKNTEWNSSVLPIRIKRTAKEFDVRLPKEVRVRIHIKGGFQREGSGPRRRRRRRDTSSRSAYMDITIEMNKGAGGEQCGHCGNFNGNRHDDNRLYDKTGMYRDWGNPALCNACVHTASRLLPPHPGEIGGLCTDEVAASGRSSALLQDGPGSENITFTLKDCHDLYPEQWQEAMSICHPEEEMVDWESLADKINFHNTCLMDVCLGGGEFGEADLEEALIQEAEGYVLHDENDSTASSP